MSFREAPERVAAPSVGRNERFGAGAAAVAVVLLLAAAGATYYLGWWGTYEHRLTASVRHPYCDSVITDDKGWGGPEMRALNEHATGRFDAFCEHLGPMVTWLRFGDVSAMHAALAATPGSAYEFETVCISEARAEVLILWDVGRRRTDDLCAARDGRVVRRH